MVNFGVVTDQEGLSYEVIRNTAIEAERLGFDSFWLNDHLFFSGKPYPECWTTLSALAEATSRIRLGVLVLCSCLRHPSLLAKMAATLDVISGGRLEFGIGAGWHEKECLAYGIPFPRAGVRIRQLREAVQLVRRMWTEERPTFRGRYYSIREAFCNPKPLQKPHPPIWIGGSGDMLLEVVAELAYGCNLSGSPEEYAQRMRLLDQYCSTYGRDTKEIQRSLMADVFIGLSDREVEGEVKARRRFQRGSRPLRNYLSYNYMQIAAHQPRKALSYLAGSLFGVGSSHSQIRGTPSQCIKKIKTYVDVGVTYFMLDFPVEGEVRGLKVFAEQVLPEFKA